MSKEENPTSVRQILDWFRKGFEPIEESTPRDDGEWVFIWGEPRFPIEIIEDHWGECKASTLAAQVIEHDDFDGVEIWVPVPDGDRDPGNRHGLMKS